MDVYVKKVLPANIMMRADRNIGTQKIVIINKKAHAQCFVVIVVYR